MADTFPDWDCVKMTPRAVFYYEAWRNVYDYEHYNDVVPTCTSSLVHNYRDFEKICELAGEGSVWKEQYETARLVVQGVQGKIPVFAGAFTPIGILLNLCGYRSIGRYWESSRDESSLIKLCKPPAGVPAEEITDLGDVTLTPGLLNIHDHISRKALRNPSAGKNFW